MENNTSAESRRGALVKATNRVMGEEPIDDVTTFRGRIARDGRARAVEEALRASSPQVSMRAVLSGIGLEKYFPHFRESGEKLSGASEVSVKEWSVARLTGFDLIEANQRQTSREIPKLHLPKKDARPRDAYVDLAKLDSDRQRMVYRQTVADGNNQARVVQFEIYRRQPEIFYKVNGLQRSVETWKRHDPRRMISGDPREEVILLWIKEAKRELAARMGSIRLQIARQRRIAMILRVLRFANLCLSIVSLLTSFIEARKVDGRLFFKTLVSSKNLTAATAYWIAFWLIFAIGRSGGPDNNDHGLKKHQRVYGLARRLDGEITSFRFDTEGKRNAKFNLMSEDIEKYFGLVSTGMSASMLNDKERLTFDKWFSGVMARPYDKEELRQQIELTKTEHLPLENIPGRTPLHRDAQRGRVPEFDRAGVVREREIFSANEYQRSAVPNLALKYQQEMYDPQREQDQLLAYEHERRAVERMLQLEDEGSAISDFSSSSYEFGTESEDSSYYDRERDEEPSVVLEADPRGTDDVEDAAEKMVDALWRICVRPMTDERGHQTCSTGELMPLIGVTCLLLPVGEDHKAAQIIKAFGIDSGPHRGVAETIPSRLVQRRLTTEEFHLFVHQGVTGLCRLLNHEMPPSELQGVIQAVSVNQPSPPEGKNGDRRMLGTGSIRRRLRRLDGICEMLMNSSVISPGMLCGRTAAESSLFNALTASHMLKIREGALFAGRYRIRQALAPDSVVESGSSSEGPLCFRVEDELIHAMKELPESLMTLVNREESEASTDLVLYVYPHFNDTSQEFQRAFRREAILLREMSARLNGRLMIRVFDFGESTANCAYQVRDLIDGLTLADYLSQRRASAAALDTLPFRPSVLHRRPIRPGLSEVPMVDLLISIISILEQLENAVLGKRCEVLEGLPNRPSIGLQRARAAGVENAGIMHLTRDARYAHPDISRAETIGVAENEATRNWDLYSLGCIAFECVCLLPPFVETNLNELSPSEPLPECEGASAGDDDEENPPLELKSRAPYPWDHEEYNPQEIRERFDETAELQGLSEAYRERIVAQQSRCRPADLRPVSAVSDELIDIIEMMLLKPVATRSVDGPRFDHLNEEPMDGEHNSEHTYADVIARLRLLKEHLEQLPSALRDALSTWTAAVGEGVMVDPATSLDLRDVPMSPFSSRYLLKFATLLENSTIRISGGEFPLHTLLQGMTTFDLNSKQLCSPDILVLARCLSACPKSAVENIDLSDNLVAFASPSSPVARGRTYDLAGLRSFVKPLRAMQLLSFDLSGNSIGPEGGELLCDALAHCAGLRTLRLSRCEILPRGGRALAKALHNFLHLKTLDIPYNYIGDEGAEAIARSLAKAEPGKPCGSLVELVLFSNSIGMIGGRSLVAACETNFTLLSLAIDQNPIPDDQLVALRSAVSFNNQFEKLIASSARFEDFGHTLMAETLQKWAARGAQVSAVRRTLLMRA
ncbi:hypothetical protein FOL46_008119, partial [Perkinsus olseni]